MNTNTNPANTDPATLSTLNDLQDLAQSPATEIEDLVCELKKVPGLSEALVQRANSPEFSLQNQILRLEHAIAVLGLRRTVETIGIQAEIHRHPPTGLKAPHFSGRNNAASSERTG